MIKQKESLFFRIFSSKIFFVLVLIFSIYLATNLYKDLQQRKRIKQEIQNLKNQINEVDTQNNDLKNLISYFETDEYAESFAREKLGFKKPGEKIIILPKQENVSNESENRNEKAKIYDNIKSWWAYFFASKNK
ncbi:MAG: septum formation initiator family protein [Patescibacteria group bacterium]|nr:septum formation initiator family protein [Patescibacteria group bacterium]